MFILGVNYWFEDDRAGSNKGSKAIGDASLIAAARQAATQAAPAAAAVFFAQMASN